MQMVGQGENKLEICKGIKIELQLAIIQIMTKQYLN